MAPRETNAHLTLPPALLHKFVKTSSWLNASLHGNGGSSSSETTAPFPFPSPTTSQSALPDISVSLSDGSFLHLLTILTQSKRILEIGTLGGYSTCWFAHGVSASATKGKIVTLELQPEFAAIASANIAHAGFADVVEVRVGPAAETLKKMDEGAFGEKETFDLVFIDADKGNNPTYLEYALKFAHVGTLVVIDNVVMQGTALGLQGQGEGTGEVDESRLGIRKALELMGKKEKEGKLVSSALQMVGDKGWDGMALAVVIA